MHNIGLFFSQYSLIAIFLIVLLEQAGLPIPALPFLILAGAASGNDALLAIQFLLLATVAATISDVIWYFVGRRYGRRVLSLLCRISLSPDTCVRKSENSFNRWGVATLVIAKFIPGLSMMAPPLAGALSMRLRNFLIFNIAGSFLWVGTGLIGGMLFHKEFKALIESFGGYGELALMIIAGLLIVYIAWRLWRRRQVMQMVMEFPRVNVDELAQMLECRSQLVIVDVRVNLPDHPLESHIPGAVHIDFASLGSESLDHWPMDTQIITYCDCPNDVSAAKAAYLIGKKGYQTRVLTGGMNQWISSGYAIENLDDSI